MSKSVMRRLNAQRDPSKALVVAKGHLLHYAHAINKIDDYFEYRAASKVDRKRVYEILEELTEALDALTRGGSN